jgi:hypothetical protein
MDIAVANFSLWSCSKRRNTQLDYRKQLPLLRAVFGEVPPVEITACSIHVEWRLCGRDFIDPNALDGPAHASQPC